MSALSTRREHTCKNMLRRAETDGMLYSGFCASISLRVRFAFLFIFHFSPRLLGFRIEHKMLKFILFLQVASTRRSVAWADWLFDWATRGVVSSGSKLQVAIEWLPPLRWSHKYFSLPFSSLSSVYYYFSAFPSLFIPLSWRFSRLSSRSVTDI